MRVLTVNAGSSSLKISVIDAGDRQVMAEDVPISEGSIDVGLLREALAQAGPVDAVGHRIVHGGTEYRQAVRIDAGVLARLWELSPLAPLHQARSLQALEEVEHLAPGVPTVACFDTAFHAGMPAGAATFAVPGQWREQWGLRRYGFHGLSHRYASRRAAELLGRPLSRLRLVSCHLGAGASLCAVQDGRSVDTTMGFTPLDGLVMATRSGAVDPGAVLWLVQNSGLSIHQIEDALEHSSGLYGLTGSADMRDVVQAAGTGDEAAQLGLSVYLHRLSAGVAAMAAAMGGLDAVVFTAGVGENSPEVRAETAGRLGFLGLSVDADLNHASGDRLISPDSSPVQVLVTKAREDLEITRDVRQVLDHPDGREPRWPPESPGQGPMPLVPGGPKRSN